MNFHFRHEGIWLHVFMTQTEIDRYDHMDGHYTEPGEWMIEEVRHKGEDIFALLSDAAIYEVMNEFERIKNEFAF